MKFDDVHRNVSRLLLILCAFQENELFCFDGFNSNMEENQQSWLLMVAIKAPPNRKNGLQ